MSIAKHRNITMQSAGKFYCSLFHSLSLYATLKVKIAKIFQKKQKLFPVYLCTTCNNGCFNNEINNVRIIIIIKQADRSSHDVVSSPLSLLTRCQTQQLHRPTPARLSSTLCRCVTALWVKRTAHADSTPPL